MLEQWICVTAALGVMEKHPEALPATAGALL